MKYRIKSKKFPGYSAKYFVQCKIFGFWITIPVGAMGRNGWFDIEQAKNWIKRRKEKPKVTIIEL